MVAVCPSNDRSLFRNPFTQPLHLVVRSFWRIGQGVLFRHGSRVRAEPTAWQEVLNSYSTSRKNEDNELLIFMTPRILKIHTADDRAP